MVDFRSMFRHVATYPRMYVLSDSYLALVSFISGCDAATEGCLLSGFGAWVAERTPGVGETSLAWPVIVAARHWPVILEGAGPIEKLPSPLWDSAKDDLMRLLDEFLTDRDDSAVIDITTGPGAA